MLRSVSAFREPTFVQRYSKKIDLLLFRIMVPATSEPDAPLMEQTLNAYEYARVLDNDPLAELVHQRLQLLPFDERFLLVLQLNDSRRCETFLHNLRNQTQPGGYCENSPRHGSASASIVLSE